MILRIPRVENEHARFTPEPDGENTAKILLKSEGLEGILEKGLEEITRMRGIQMLCESEMIKVEITEIADLYPRAFLKFCSSFQICFLNNIWPSQYTLNNFLSRGYDESTDGRGIKWEPFTLDVIEYEFTKGSLIVEGVFEVDCREIEWAVFYEELKHKYL